MTWVLRNAQKVGIQLKLQVHFSSGKQDVLSPISLLVSVAGEGPIPLIYSKISCGLETVNF